MILPERFSRSIPNTLFARIAAVLLLNLILVQGVSFAFVSLESRRLRPEDRLIPERVAAGMQILNSVAAADRPRFAHALSGFGFQVRYLPADVTPPPVVDDGPLAARIQQVVGEANGGASAKPITLYRLGPPADDESGAEGRYAVGLADGSWMEFRPRRGPPPIHWYPIVSLVAAVCVVVSLLALIFARNLSRRLTEFARIADAFGRSIDSGPLPETGPKEIRLASHAFNLMQERLRRFITDRTRMLAAISHDLRTPLTRLRLRAEFVDDAEQRTKMLGEIAEMEAMLNETMAFARDDAAREQRQPADLDQMLADLAASMREAGHEVDYLPSGPQVVEISPIAMRRALGNLLENAVNYGGSAKIELSRAAEQVIIAITDRGPGIDPAMMEQVFQPFFRLEVSRNRDTGGVGLGLSVARTIIRGHGGDIALDNQPSGGLRVTVTLPA